MKDIFKNYVYPVAAFTGSIIGVGFLSLPYIASRVGIWPMIFYFVVLTGLVILIHVIFGQICLKTPDFKRWPGFVGFYLGRYAKGVVLVTTTLGSFGVLLVYLIIGSQFLTAIFNPMFGGRFALYVIVYFALVGTCVYLGVKAISKVDFLALLLLVGILFFIFIKGFAKIHAVNIFATGAAHLTFTNLFLPYGAILFSLWGVGLIPEIEEMVAGNKKTLKKIIIISTALAALFYLAFIFVILGITGSRTTESALVGLRGPLGGTLISVALFIGVISTFIAFIAQGLLLKKIFMYDMGIKEFPAWVFTCFPPFILFYMGFNSFIPLISFIGGVLLSIDGILILLMYKKIGGKKIIIYPLVIFFVLGIVYELVYFFH